MAYSSLALAIQNANLEDLRVIADEAQEGVDGYYTSPFMVLKDGPINKVEDLKGKVVGDRRPGRGGRHRHAGDAQEARP